MHVRASLRSLFTETMPVRLATPITSASIFAVVVCCYVIVKLTGDGGMDPIDRFRAVWPIALTSSAAIVLVMSLLYQTILGFVHQIELREEQARYQAVHDPLTGLANRTLLIDSLNNALERSRRAPENVAVLTIDLDRFKQVNDTHGHAAGDDLICQVANKLKALIRETDTVARLGGDEFAIIQPGPLQIDDIEALGRRIIAALSEPICLSGNEVRIGASIGAAIAPRDGVMAEDLMRKSDIALYRMKDLGRNGICLFDEELDAKVRRKAKVEQSLRRGLLNGDTLALHYQPQISCSSRKVVGVEALVRSDDKDLGPVSAFELVTVAESVGLIDALGEMVFFGACEAAKHWPQLFVAVNVSSLQFRTKGFANRLIDIARENGVDPSQIELEITESLEFDEQFGAAKSLADLRQAGFRIVLDDFGTGFSSLSYLTRLQVDKLKIDQSFIKRAREGDNAVAVIRSIVDLGHAIKLAVIAEGVETAAQEAIIRAAGCDQWQGYRFSPPVSMDEVDRLLANRTQRSAA